MEPQLTLNDFTAVVNMIDVCTERGAFKGNELLVVGQLRERFAAFVKSKQEEQQTQAEPEEESAE